MLSGVSMLKDMGISLRQTCILATTVCKAALGGMIHNVDDFAHSYHLKNSVHSYCVGATDKICLWE